MPEVESFKIGDLAGLVEGRHESYEEICHFSCEPGAQFIENIGCLHS